MRRLLLFTLILFASKALLGQSQILGGEIYYKQLDSLKYELTAQIYRDCRGVAINSINGSVYADSIKLPLNFRRISIENISENCGTNTCININAPSSAGGIEKHIFKDTIDFTQSPYDSILNNNLCEVYFGIYFGSWNFAINTIVNPSFFIDAMVNICHQKAFIHSPEFSNKPLYQACCNQTLSYNPGILKFEDTDSFSFELAGVLNNYNTNAVYSWNLTKTIPMTPFCPPAPGVVNCRPLPNAKPPRGVFYDPIVNDIVFTPTKCDETGVIKFQVKQWQYNKQLQKMELIGYVNRQMLIIVKTCPDNNPPYFASNTNIYNVCLGDSITLNIAAKDEPFLPNQTSADTTFISWSNNLENASFTYLDSNAREKTAVLKWKATGNSYQITQKYFTVKVIDKICSSQSIKGVLLNIYPKKSSKVFFKDFKGCNYLTLNNEINDSINKLSEIEFKYTITKISPEFQIAFTSKKQKDVFKYNSSGKYVIASSVVFKVSNCGMINYDTIDLTAIYPLNFNKKDSFVCVGDSLILGNSQITNQVKVKWESPIGFIIKDSSSTYSHINSGKDETIRMKIKNEFCDTFYDVNIYSGKGFNANYNDTCFSQRKNILLKLQNTKVTPPFQTLWIINSKDSVFKKDYGSLDVDSSMTIEIQVIKNPKCIENKMLELRLSPPPPFNFTDSSIVCYNNTKIIKPNYHANKTSIISYQWSVNNNIIQNNDSFLNFIFTNPLNKIELKVIDSLSCFNSQTMNINTTPIFKIHLIDSTKCPNNSLFLSVKDTSSTPLNYSWSIDGIYQNNNSNKLTYPFKNNQFVQVEVSDTFGCKIEKSLNTNILSRPDFDIIPPPPFCSGTNLIIQLNIKSNTPIIRHLWFFNGENTYLTDQIYYNKFGDYNIVKHILTDENNCVAEKEIIIKANNTNVKISGRVNYNYHDYVQLNSDQNYQSYLWNNNITTKENGFWAKSLGPPGIYSISLQVTDSIGCKGSDQIHISTNQFTNITTQDLNQFQIFPNPSDGNITIQTNIKESIEIYSINGQLMHSQWIEVGTNSLDLSHLNKGVYFVKIAHRYYKLVIGVSVNG